MLNDFGTRTRWSAACEVLKDIAASDTLGLTDIDVGAIITFGGDTAQTIYPDDGELTALSKFSEEFTLPAQPSAWARTH
jgi:hypothetical protein